MTDETKTEKQEEPGITATEAWENFKKDCAESLATLGISHEAESPEVEFKKLPVDDRLLWLSGHVLMLTEHVGIILKSMALGEQTVQETMEHLRSAALKEALRESPTEGKPN